MKRGTRAAAFIMIILIVISLLPITASANAGSPPLLTVMVMFAPEDLQITLRNGNGATSEPVVRTSRGFDTFYTFWGWDWSSEDGTELDLSRMLYENMSLIITTGGETFGIPLPEDGMYHGLYTLDLTERSLTPGSHFVRDSILVALRIILTLLIEGLIFWAFRIRGRWNWMVFLVINLITQGGLNIIFSSPDLGSAGYWIVGLFALEILIVIIETTAFCLLLKDIPAKTEAGSASGYPRMLSSKHAWKPIIYPIAANVASLILGTYLITAFMVQYG